MDNLKLWESVATTRTTDVKKVEFGRKFTAINAHSQILQATRTFGPCGIGWGVRNSRYEVLIVDPSDAHYNLLQYTGELWYLLDGKTGTLDISADIELFEWSNKNSKWARVDDTHKKVKTDALTKGLSWLGFNADVFMGLYDDNKYVSGLKNREAQESASAKKPGPAPAADAKKPANQPAAKPPAPPAEQKPQPPFAKTPAQPPAPATDGQRKQIQAVCSSLSIDGVMLADWLRATYGVGWNGLNSIQAADIHHEISGLMAPHPRSGGINSDQLSLIKSLGSDLGLSLLGLDMDCRALYEGLGLASLSKLQADDYSDRLSARVGDLMEAA